MQQIMGQAKSGGREKGKGRRAPRTDFHCRRAKGQVSYIDTESSSIVPDTWH